MVTPDRTPSITRTPFVPIDAPDTLRVWFCPACGQQITGSYNLDPAKKRCTKTWHLATPKPVDYTRESYALARDEALAEIERLRDVTCEIVNELAVSRDFNGRSLDPERRGREWAFSTAHAAVRYRLLETFPASAEATQRRTCGRLLVGQGDDTYDPECVLPAGHEPPCAPTATPEGEYARNQREAVEHIQTLPPSERSAVENRPGQTPPTTHKQD